MEPVQAKAPTIVETVKNNYELILECIDYANKISGILTAEKPSEDNQIAPSCVMDDLINQTEKIIVLRDILKKLHFNVIEGGN